MNKQEIISKYANSEDKLFASKIMDKIEMCKTQNKMVNTDFLDMHEKNIAEKIIENFEINKIFYGGFDEAERTILIIYPEKIPNEVIETIFERIIKIIKIDLPSDLYDKYTHKNYLGAVMKLGIKRNKIGDIKVRNAGADIIVCSDMSEYIVDKLKELTRFSKSTIYSANIKELENTCVKKQELSIIIPSPRLDCVVSEMIRVSRTKVNEIISMGRVFVNGENILKNSKSVNVGDMITVRGKGRFEIAEQKGTTKKGRIVLKVLKYI